MPSLSAPAPSPAESAPATAPGPGLVAPPPFGAFEYFPDNLEWSTQMLRLFGYASIGGADFTEVQAVARDLPVGDDAAWMAGFTGLARRLDEQARASAAGGHAVTARQTWLRASIAYRIAGQMAAIGGTDVPGVDDSRRCFRSAVAPGTGDRRVEAVDLPFEGKALAGYRVAPRLAVDGGAVAEPGPAVIVSGGIDAFSEEMYLKIGVALSDRGYTALLVDGPGQGESRRRGIHGRADYETAAAVMVDHLRARPDIDPDRIGFIGSSLGGYNAVRVAAFEPRVRATAIWAAPPDFSGRHSPMTAPSASRVSQMAAYLGADTADELVAGLVAMDLEGVAEQVTGSVLMVHGESDQLVSVDWARELFDQFASVDKRLVVYPAGQPGCVHCQMDSVPLVQRDLCDWLDDQLKEG
jgi:alpha-beta hydrolase superfamily lysophospholipase